MYWVEESWPNKLQMRNVNQKYYEGELTHYTAHGGKLTLHTAGRES
jgi:hypothetical protein